jgi:hypothetical protein
VGGLEAGRRGLPMRGECYCAKERALRVRHWF